ncbi:sigma-70 family RNA polymerase sigma factor [Bacillus massiliigorillae]|uniref:sigma-70 family RNA polymerase sigma factor n=1 Tax=Bacillus massiliigorillae TaxID=1243664 RepID=UPI00039BC492|nr:sigma-70 family RNA polymerase sigma factor [Bacillus massiliigorillae]
MGEQSNKTKIVKHSHSDCNRSYEELYEATIHDVYKTVYFLIEDKTDADDVIQDIYLQLYKSLKKYNDDKPFKPWLMGIAMKHISAYRRKRWMRLRIAHKAETYKPNTFFDFSDDLINKISNEQLLTLVNQLPFKLKQVVILHYLNDQSQEDVANILNIPIGTVKSRINAALKNLRQKEKVKHLLKESGEII